MIRSLSREALYLLIFLLCLSVDGCKGTGPSGRHGSTLVVGLEGNPTSLDPRVAQDAYSTRIFPLVFEGLLVLDKNSDPAPFLARSWDEPDELTYIFHLERGHRDPRGDEITARDVVYTFESLNDPALRSPRRVLLKNIREVKALDDQTVRIRLTQPYAPFLTDMTLGIVPQSAGERGPEVASDFQAIAYGVS